MGKYYVDDVIRRWVREELCSGEYGPEGYLKDGTIKLWCERGAIYSANNFQLALSLYDRGFERPRLLVVNGDLGTRTNSFHQATLREALNDTEAPYIIVPFSALDAASIDKTTIQPIEIREDRFTRITHRVAPWNKDEIRWRNYGGGYRNTRGVEVIWQRGRIKNRSDIEFQRCIERNGRDRETEFYVRTSRTWDEVDKDSHGYYWVENRHWLGDSTFRAKVNGRYRTFVSSFDYQEPTPLYYLAEVPPGALVNSVDDAVLALSPPIVHAAVAQKRDVKRQGDMFAIPTNLTTEDVLARTKGGIMLNQGVFGTDHVASEVAVGKGRVTYARGVVEHKPEGRRRDHQPCSLGDIWHLMVPNAVPRRKRGMQARV